MISTEERKEVRTWLVNLWDSFRTGFWFIPAILIVTAICLAIVLPEVDRQLDGVMPDWLKTAGDTARSTLASLASATLTLAGVAFSVTVVTLSTTSSQLGPRLLRNFLGESITQFTLGICLACSIYCFVLLWRIDDATGSWFVPHLSVALAALMTLAVLCLIVYFIHRVAQAIQPMHVVAEVSHDLDAAIDRLFPDRIGEAPPDEHDHASVLEQVDNKPATAVKAAAEGYLQAINGDVLLQVAIQNDLLIVLNCRPGDYLISGRQIANCHPETKCPSEVAKQISEAFLVGNQRTPRQDVRCAVDELVEVAVRALSPGINDPFTAMASIDRLSGAFCRLAERETPSAIRVDDEHTPRVITKPTEFPEILHAGFSLLRQHSARSITVSLRLLHALRVVAQSAHSESYRNAILQQAELVLEGVQLQKYCKGDTEEVKSAYEEAIAACN